jgi:hypothetical protein
MNQKLNCELCDFVTTKKTDLAKHLQKAHRGAKVCTITCPCRVTRSQSYDYRIYN